MADLVCFTLTTNRASQQIMEKAGFEYERDVFYRITGSEWKEDHGLRWRDHIKKEHEKFGY